MVLIQYSTAASTSIFGALEKFQLMVKNVSWRNVTIVVPRDSSEVELKQISDINFKHPSNKFYINEDYNFRTYWFYNNNGNSEFCSVEKVLKSFSSITWDKYNLKI